MQLFGVRHDYPEPRGFFISRPNGREDYTFLQFLTEVQLRVGDTWVTVRPGGCIFYPPHMPQHFTADVPLLHNWLHADASLHDALVRYRLPEGELFYPHNVAFVSELLARIEAEYASVMPAREAMIDAYMTELLIKLSRELTERRAAAPTDDEHVRRLRTLRQQILEYPERHRSIAQMASCLSVSPSRFHTIYKAYFGTTPVQDMIDSRIFRAKVMLETDQQIKIGALAKVLGYNDAFSFIRQFRRATGLSPDRYRQTHGAPSQNVKENDKMH